MATSKKAAAPAKPAAELRVYLTLTDLQPQFSSWMSSPLGARGYVAMQGTHACWWRLPLGYPFNA